MTCSTPVASKAGRAFVPARIADGGAKHLHAATDCDELASVAQLPRDRHVEALLDQPGQIRPSVPGAGEAREVAARKWHPRSDK